MAAEVITSGTIYDNAKKVLKDIMKDEKFVVCEINLSAADGLAIHNLDGTVTASVELPFSVEKGKTINVYRVEGDKYVKCESEIRNNRLYFTTNHFSTYVFVETALSTASPETGDSNSFPFWVIMLLVGASIWLLGRKVVSKN